MIYSHKRCDSVIDFNGTVLVTVKQLFPSNLYSSCIGTVPFKSIVTMSVLECE